MPEGDTIYRTAATLRRALLGRTVLALDTTVEGVAAVLEDAPVAGRVISGVEARGKHLLVAFAAPGPPSGGGAGGAAQELVLHTHMRMTGSWHLYRPGERWRKPERLAKVVIRTEAFVAPCFSAPVVELLTRRQAERHPDLAGLGPDAIAEEFDVEEAVRRLRSRPEVEIGVGLLNQRAMAGVGNVYKSEVLFLRRVSPFRRIGDLDEAALGALAEEARRLLRLNRGGGLRRTAPGLRAGERLWVYGRAGEPCRVCGEVIRMRRQGVDARATYFCPRCQATAG